MIAVSDAWKQKQLGFLSPEGFIEISYLVSEDGLQESALARSDEEAVISKVENTIEITEELPSYRLATTEMNLWRLDGTMNVFDTEEDVGYVSSSFGAGTVEVALDEIHEQPLQGITIQWSKVFNEWATDFTVTAYRDNTEIVSKTVSGNESAISEVELEIEGYNRIKISVSGWNVPDHRARIERITLGVTKIYLKGDLMTYKHSQTGSPVSGELPKNSIEFSLDNSDGKWNPNNPTGYERYLSERQKIKVRYGFDINGTTEWIKAGTFYLSEWRTPSNGIEVTFSARDLFEYMIDKAYTGITGGTLYNIATKAIELSELPKGSKVSLDDSLKEHNASFDGEYSCAEILQMCANAAQCVIWQDREGTLRVERKNVPVHDYAVTGDVSYSYPEYELSKPLKSVTVNYGEDSQYVLNVGRTGEVQELTNPFISNQKQAEDVAKWVENTIRFRKNVSGEYRADPRLDVFDKIRVEGKYGVNSAVVITNVTYSFTGAFKGSFEGVVTEFNPVNAAFCGEIYVGEV